MQLSSKNAPEPHRKSFTVHKVPRLALLIVTGMLLVLALAACNDTYKLNPLGYNYVVSQFGKSTPSARTTPPAVTPQASPDPVLKHAGMGNTLDTFLTLYGAPLAISRPPTQYVFQTTVEAWPGGSVLVVDFENGAQDALPRAIQFSFVPGTNHPTTYEQAQALVEALLPSDITGPVTANQQNQDKRICLSKNYYSPILAQLFPAQDFIGQNGKIGKAGDVIVSFFPSLVESTFNNAPQGDIGGNDEIADPNTISSVLIALGDRPSC